MSTHYFGPGSFSNTRENIKNAFVGLDAVRGTCIFIDICGSTSLKKEHNLEYWIFIIKNSFEQGYVLPSMDKPLKIIGDELMYFIPDSDLDDIQENHASLFNIVKGFVEPFKNILADSTLRLKAAMHYCTNVYPITFFQDARGIPVPDYYGTGIDLTARLMQKTDQNRVVISKEFYDLIKIYKDVIADLDGPYFEENFKGFEDYPVEYWYWQFKEKEQLHDIKFNVIG